uniref:Uncharacterized protein LOC116948517 isoform X3 n=1 Tax=Petromyzon marinus TaxID=7757 RepID=A0AAJ7TNI4_PETMA|nr:uncharacterized protein LOC116948517 isoform X3 [Petromyzon marinus]
MEDPRWPMTNVVSRRQAAAILPTLVMKAAAAVAAAGGGAGGAAVWTSIQGRCGSSLPKTVKPLHTEGSSRGDSFSSRPTVLFPVVSPAAAPSPSRIPSRTSARRLAERLRCDHSNSEVDSRSARRSLLPRADGSVERRQSIEEKSRRQADETTPHLHPTGDDLIKTPTFVGMILASSFVSGSA